MARTIGRKFKNLLKSIVAEEAKTKSGYELEEAAFKKMPAEAFDTWESAHDEIRRLISDEAFKIRREKWQR